MYGATYLRERGRDFEYGTVQQVGIREGGGYSEEREGGRYFEIGTVI